MKRGELRVVSDSDSAQRLAERQTEVGDAPDISMPNEALIWRSSVRAGVQVDVSGVERRFLERRLHEVRAGVMGRGFVAIDNGLLTVEFGLTDREIDGDDVLVAYTDALLEYLGLPDSAIVEQRVAGVHLTPDAEAEAERLTRRLGIRALSVLE